MVYIFFLQFRCWKRSCSHISFWFVQYGFLGQGLVLLAVSVTKLWLNKRHLPRKRFGQSAATFQLARDHCPITARFWLGCLGVPRLCLCSERGLKAVLHVLISTDITHMSFLGHASTEVSLLSMLSLSV